MAAARLSVVLPVLNEAVSLGAALQALAPLLARGAEVIAADGGSSDHSAALAQAGGAQLVNAPRGRALQMNAGAAQARGDVLLFLHADTVLPDGADALIREALASGAQVWGRFDVTITGRPRMLKLIAALMNLRSRRTGIATGDQALVMTRAAFETVGGFPAQPLMEDIEMSRRLLKLSRPACLRAKVQTSGRRWESHGVWRTVLLMWRLRFAYWRGTAPERLAELYR
ncbi:MAG: TIGR04283 family arsenosugar biosynthesis glycosyltransferase [Pseudohongiella sp.]|nr:TIGR04283 family arsenosugar biosynthesis glycosyltransferase [Pseudohongiella sp.]